MLALQDEPKFQSYNIIILEGGSKMTYRLWAKGMDKSSLVFKALKGQEGVVHLALNPCDSDYFFTSIFKHVTFKPNGTNTGHTC